MHHVFHEITLLSFSWCPLLLTLSAVVIGHIFFTDVRYIVLDEADTLVGADFASAVDKIVKPIQVLQRLRSYSTEN